jgi:hypothetical protein
MNEEPMEEEIPAQVLVSVKIEKMDISMTGLASLADSPSTSQDMKPVVKGKACLQEGVSRKSCVCGVETLMIFSTRTFRI